MDKNHRLKLDTEIISAFMDNNLSSQDMELVAKAINSSPEMMDLCSMNDIVEEAIAENGSAELPQELMSEEFSIPSLEELHSSNNDKIGVYETLIEDSLIAVSDTFEENYFDSLSISDRLAPSSTTKLEDIKNDDNMENKDLLNIGYKPNQNQDTFDPQIYQGYNPSCAVCSQEIILRDFGIIIPREELIKFATKQGWYDPDPERGGTPKEDVGNILDACGIQTTRYENACFGDLVKELSAGHRVIVSVDADELWINKEKGLYKRLFGEVKNRLSDAVENTLGIEGANHALVVAGINVNPKDPNDVRVVLIDSGSGDYCIEYSWKQFSDALADSHNYIIATQEAAPYQYNYTTNELEPSGYESNFVPSLAQLPDGLHNNFSLPDQYYDQYEYFSPFFTKIHPFRVLGVSNIDDYLDDSHSKEDNFESESSDTTGDGDEQDSSVGENFGMEDDNTESANLNDNDEDQNEDETLAETSSVEDLDNNQNDDN